MVTFHFQENAERSLLSALTLQQQVTKTKEKEIWEQGQHSPSGPEVYPSTAASKACVQLKSNKEALIIVNDTFNQWAARLYTTIWR